MCTVKKKLSVTKKAATNIILDGHFQSFKMLYIKKKKATHSFLI